MFQIISSIIGISSLIYFIMLAICVGLTNEFTYFWILLGVVCIVSSIFSHKIINIWSSLHIGIRGSIIGVVSISAVIVAVILGIIIKNGVNKPEQGADYIIVLGGQVRGTVPSLNLAKRLDKAYEYLQNSPETKVIVSGGQGTGEDITEAEAMNTYLINKGIAKERIIMEDKSVNTHENIKFSKKLMNKKEPQIVIVTSSFHVYRGIRIAKKQGLNNVEGLGSTIRWYTVPNLYLREAMAIIKYYICGQI